MTERPTSLTSLQYELDQRSSPIGRRAFLGVAGLGLSGIIFGKAWSDTLDESSIGKKAAELGAPIGRWTYFTVTDDYPSMAKSQYQLRISGLVDRPTTLTYADLLKRKPTSMTKDFQCVTGWRVRNVPWTGVLLSDLLDEVGVQSGATALRFTSFDGEYTESLTLEQARRSDMLVAYSMLGADITTNHGGPVRLYAAPMYGYKSIKWLDGIEVVDRVTPGYWEERGYDVDAWTGRSNGRDDEAT